MKYTNTWNHHKNNFRKKNTQTHFIFNSPKHPCRTPQKPLHSLSLYSSPVTALGKNIMKSSAPSDECEVAGVVSLKEASEKCYLCWATCSSDSLKGRTSFPRENSMCVWVCVCVCVCKRRGERVESFVRMLVDWKAKNVFTYCAR